MHRKKKIEGNYKSRCWHKQMGKRQGYGTAWLSRKERHHLDSCGKIEKKSARGMSKKERKFAFQPRNWYDKTNYRNETAV